MLVTHDLDEARLLADRIVHHPSRHARCRAARRDRGAARARRAARWRGWWICANVFEGTVSALAADGTLHLRWRGYTLEVRSDGVFRPGERVDWVVPSRFVILHRRDKPSRGEHENPVGGLCTECTMLGDNALVSIDVDGDVDASLAFSVPAHAARRNGLAPGVEVRVSLLAEGIHLMPGKR
ncbi:MAG: hypothetical protein MZW92_80030 [Comamonadaceae bacterium]|nr:hypothetical protein [Comamonadaceae bacterium]